jgi:hypothetical protein
VIDGILCIAHRYRTPHFRAAAERLGAGDVRGALVEALIPEARSLPARAANIASRLGRRLPERAWEPARMFVRRRVLESELTFAGAARLLRNRSFGDYLVHRYAHPSFIGSIPLLLLLKELPEPAPGGPPLRVLDFAGGAGHSAYLISRLFPRVQVILTDRDFANLYLARRFMAPGAVCVCVDGEMPVPLGEGMLDAVFCLDSFDQIQQKMVPLASLMRAAKPGALWIMPQLRNASRFSHSMASPLEPREYRRVLGRAAALSGREHGPWRMFAMARVMKDYLERRIINLAEPAPERELGEAFAVALVGGGRGDLWRVHHLEGMFPGGSRGVGLNPIYRRRGGAGGAGAEGRDVELELSWPSGSLARDCAPCGRCLPERVRVPRRVYEELRGAGRGDPPGRRADGEELDPLVRRFVAVPMPPRYC